MWLVRETISVISCLAARYVMRSSVRMRRPHSAALRLKHSTHNCRQFAGIDRKNSRGIAAIYFIVMNVLLWRFSNLEPQQQTWVNKSEVDNLKGDYFHVLSAIFFHTRLSFCLDCLYSVQFFSVLYIFL